MKKGFTLIEVLMVIVLIAILGGGSLALFSTSLEEAKFDATYKEMLQLRKALIGDLENTSVEGERVRFGYLGDLGAVPNDSQGLRALYSLPASVNPWTVDASGKIGLGWNGPYIISSTDNDFAKDAWGRDYIYSTAGTTPYLLSYGADGVAGGTGTDADISVEIPRNIRSATVTGQLIQSGSVYNGSAYVELFYPASDGTGTMNTEVATLSSGGMGRFTFSNVPFGVRSVKISIPDITTPAIKMGPITFAVDNENYFIKSNFLEINPDYDAVLGNCNSIGNMTFVPGSFTIYEDDNGTGSPSDDIHRIKFKINIERSFSVNGLYTWNNGTASGGKGQKLVSVGIGGVVYGCMGALAAVVGNPINRNFVGCDNNASGNTKQLNEDDGGDGINLDFESAWGIASGQNIPVFMDVLDSTGITRVDFHLGCDRIVAE